MPARDGTGPPDGARPGRWPFGRGRRTASSGTCICPACGAKSAHTRARPCSSRKCSRCGTLMIRQ